MLQIIRIASVIYAHVHRTASVSASLLFEHTCQRFFQPRPWLEVQLDGQEFENMFKDSGYWDYFLLSYYDQAFRIYAVYSLFVVSDFSIVEKASWLLTGTICWALGIKFFLELRTLGEFLFFMLVWVLLFFSCAFFLVTVCTFLG